MRIKKCVAQGYAIKHIALLLLHKITQYYKITANYEPVFLTILFAVLNIIMASVCNIKL